MKLVIKHHRPLRRFLIGLGAALAVLFAIAVAFDYGHWRYTFDSISATSEKRDLIEQNVQLKRQNEDLKHQLGRQNRISEVDQQSRVESQRYIAALQSDIAELKQELEFYRDILASTEAQIGPQVQGLQIRNSGDKGRYVYRLVLTHVNKDDKVTKGHVEMAIEGSASGVDQRLALAEMAEAGSDDMSFNFKHFRRFEGTLRMPEDFVPEHVHVKVQESGRKGAAFSKAYDWSEIAN
jgi:hypothetical protein